MPPRKTKSAATCAPARAPPRASRAKPTKAAASKTVDTRITKSTNGLSTTRNGKPVTIHRYRLSPESLAHLLSLSRSQINWREGMFLKVPIDELAKDEEARERDENWEEAGKKLMKKASKTKKETKEKKKDTATGSKVGSKAAATATEKEEDKETRPAVTATKTAKARAKSTGPDVGVTVEIMVHKKLAFLSEWPEVLGVADWNLEDIKAAEKVDYTLPSDTDEDDDEDNEDNDV